MRFLVAPVAQVRGVIPQNADSDAHARRDEVPQIPLSQQDADPMKITAIDAGAARPNGTGHIDPLEVRADQNGIGGSCRSRQETFRTPQK